MFCIWSCWNPSPISHPQQEATQSCWSGCDIAELLDDKSSKPVSVHTWWLFPWQTFFLIDFSGVGGEKEKNNYLLSHLFMHSLVDSCMYTNLGSNPQPCISGWCSQLSYADGALWQSSRFYYVQSMSWMLVAKLEIK